MDSEYTHVDFVKCDGNKNIIIKTNKFCDIDDLRYYTNFFYRNENGKAEYIKVTGCKKLNSDCTKFRLILKDSLMPGIKYTAYNDQKYFICYFEFEYQE